MEFCVRLIVELKYLSVHERVNIHPLFFSSGKYPGVSKMEIA
jgi:hypothetical protein